MITVLPHFQPGRDSQGKDVDNDVTYHPHENPLKAFPLYTAY